MGRTKNDEVHRDLRLRHHVLAQPEIPRKTAVSVVPLHLVLLSAPPMPSTCSTECRIIYDRTAGGRIEWHPEESNIHSEYSPVRHNGVDSVSVPRDPIVTGTSVLAFKYKDGIIMATDNLGEDCTILNCFCRLSLSAFSFIRLTRTLQGHAAYALRRLVYRHWAPNEMSDFQQIQRIFESWWTCWARKRRHTTTSISSVPAKFMMSRSVRCIGEDRNTIHYGTLLSLVG